MTYPTPTTPILSWGIETNLAPVLSWIQGVITEFIPYLVYMALWVLIVTLGFVAVKWLVNWTSRRVTGVFSSRRKRR